MYKFYIKSYVFTLKSECFQLLFLLGHQFTFELKRLIQVTVSLIILYHLYWEQNFLYWGGGGHVMSSLTYRNGRKHGYNHALYTADLWAADGDLSPAGHPWGVQAFLHTSDHVEERPKWPSASGVHNNGPYPPKACWGWLAFVLTRWVRESFRDFEKAPAPTHTLPPSPP